MRKKSIFRIFLIGIFTFSFTLILINCRSDQDELETNDISDDNTLLFDRLIETAVSKKNIFNIKQSILNESNRGLGASFEALYGTPHFDKTIHFTNRVGKAIVIIPLTDINNIVQNILVGFEEQNILEYRVINRAEKRGTIMHLDSSVQERGEYTDFSRGELGGIFTNIEILLGGGTQPSFMEIDIDAFEDGCWEWGDCPDDCDDCDACFNSVPCPTSGGSEGGDGGFGNSGGGDPGSGDPGGFGGEGNPGGSGSGGSGGYNGSGGTSNNPHEGLDGLDPFLEIFETPCPGDPLNSIALAPQLGASGREGGLFGCVRYGSTDCTTPRNKKHSGLDLASPSGTDIHSMYSGVVTKVNYQANGAGYYTTVQSVVNGDIINILYFHLMFNTLSEGDTIEQGDIIGLQGDSGNLASAILNGNAISHLHIKIKDSNGIALDPREYLGTPMDSLGFTTPNPNCD